MRRKLFVALLFALVFLLGTLPAFASGLDGITTFGYSDLRDRSLEVNSLGFWPSWMSDFGQSIGTSYSQPLIVHDPTGNKDVYVVAAGGGNNPTIMIWKDIQATPDTTYLKQDANPPVWSASLPGNLATFSHPSLYNMNGHDILFIGSNNASGGAHIMAWDVTNVLESKGSGSETPLLDKADPYASDIVSAPMLEYWQGHPVVIYTDGNSSRIDVAYNIDRLESGQSPDKPLFHYFPIGTGGGRTSSSPAPVMGNTAFVVGWDGGGRNGGIYVYRLDDIFTTAADGSMMIKEDVQPYSTGATHAGMDQSFSVNPSNTDVIYFGDSRSNIYGFNTSSGTWLWSNKTIPNTYGYPDDFSNRSSALDGTNVYFSFGTGTSARFGGVIAVSRSTGQKAWISNGGNSLVGYDQYGNPGNPTNAQTAPVVADVMNSPTNKYILEGLGSGQVVQIDASNGTEYPWIYSTMVASQLSKYAKGITGEISAWSDFFAVTYDDGILAGSLVPMDLAVTDPDNPTGPAKIEILDSSGQPVQQDAQGNFIVKAGQSYLVKAGYAYLTSPDGSTSGTDWELPTVPMAGLHNVGGSWDSQTGRVTGGTWYSFQSLTNQNGQPVPQKSLYSGYTGKWQQEFYEDLQHQGSNGVIQFNWTPTAADASSTNFLAVGLNTMLSGLVQFYPEDNLKNNLVTAAVKIEAPQLVVTPAPTTGNGQSSQPNLSVVPPTATIQVHDSLQFRAEYYPEGKAAGNGQDVTTSAAWLSSRSGIATVGYATGLAQGESPGTTDIEATYSGLEGQAVLNVTAPPAPNQSGGLTFQATSQYGGYQRPVNTAKWTDTVTATLDPPVQNMIGWGYGGSAAAPPAGTIAPPQPGSQPGSEPPPQGDASLVGAQSHLTTWALDDANVTYPAQNPQYSFDDPKPPEGTDQTTLTPDGHTASGTFKEMWAEDGSPVFDVITGQNVGPPKNYTLTANYDYTADYYEVFWFQPPPPPPPPGGGSSPPPPPYPVYVYPPSYHGTGSLSGQLLVNGTGTAATGL